MSEREWALVDDGGDVVLRPCEGRYGYTLPLAEAEQLYAQLGKAIEDAKNRKKNGPFEKWLESLERCPCGNPSCEVRFVNGFSVVEGPARSIWESMQKAMKEEE